MMKNIAILGSTGSIGTQTLDIVRYNQDVRVTALAAGGNVCLMERQIREFKPRLACLWDEEKAKEAAGELYISYGSDTVTDQVAQSMLWKDGEKVYIITAMDNPMIAQDMARMAGELIDNKQ